MCPPTVVGLVFSLAWADKNRAMDELELPIGKNYGGNIYNIRSTMLADLRGTPRFEALPRDYSGTGVRLFLQRQRMKLWKFLVRTEATNVYNIVSVSPIAVVALAPSFSRYTQGLSVPWKSRPGCALVIVSS